METRLLLRNGEQLLLALVIPVLALVAGVAAADRLDLDLGDQPVDVLTPGVLALAVLSTAFTSLAIATGFERRYGLLKRLGASPLPRHGLLLGKVGALLLVELVQVVVVGAVGLALGWEPDGERSPPRCSRSCSARPPSPRSGCSLAGALRAEATLAIANLVYLLLLTGGGVVLPDRGVRRPRPGARVAAVRGARRGDARRAGRRVASTARSLVVLLAWAVAGALLTVADVPMGVTMGEPMGDSPSAIEGWLWRLSVANLVANMLIVVTGGAVRVTGSGLGCPTWPRCTEESYVAHGALGVHGAIEFGNRMLTFVLVAIAIACWVVARCCSSGAGGRQAVAAARLATAVVLGIPAQAVIGGITVLTDLNP